MESIGDIDSPVRCNHCGGEFTLRQLILAAEGCSRSMEVVRSRTPCCQSVEELWLRSGRASRGYIYAAGQAHFADMEQYDAPRLVVRYGEERVVVGLDGAERCIERG